VKTLWIRNNNCSFEVGEMVVGFSALRGSSEHLGQPADHFRGKQSFGAVGIWKPESQSFGTVRKGLTGRCPTKGIDLSSEGSQGLERKRIGSRPAIELRFDPRAAFFVPLKSFRDWD
jgi:hypothetical protein